MTFANKYSQRQTKGNKYTWLWRLSVNLSFKNVLNLQIETNIKMFKPYQDLLAPAPGSRRAACAVDTLWVGLAPPNKMQACICSVKDGWNFQCSFLKLPQPPLDHALGSTYLTSPAHSLCLSQTWWACKAHASSNMKERVPDTPRDAYAWLHKAFSWSAVTVLQWKFSSFGLSFGWKVTWKASSVQISFYCHKWLGQNIEVQRTSSKLLAEFNDNSPWSTLFHNLS